MKMLNRFEDLVFANEHIAAFEQLQGLLTVLSARLNGEEWHFNGTRRQVGEIYTRLAAAMTSLIANPAMPIERPQFLALCRHSGAIHDVYEASGYGGTGILLQAFSRTDASGARRLTSRDLSCLWPMFSLDDIPEKLFDLALRQPNEVLFPLGMAWLQHESVLTAQGEENRARLLATLTQMDPGAFQPELLLATARVWMFCSYASSPAKHEIKRTLNQMLARWLNSHGMQPNCKASRDPVRPTLLVVGERFRSTHAMFRCFAPSIRALGKKFRLVLIAEEDQYDESAKAIFEQIIALPTGGSRFGDMLQNVAAIEPDVIYFPSVGMSLWAILLANLRLAPIQLMSGGHPASSMSGQMDYFLMSRSMQPVEGVCTEKVIWLDSDTLFEPHPFLQLNADDQPQRDPNTFNVAINSKVMKLSCGLLDVCERLEKQSSKRLCFHFFPGVSGVKYDSLRNRLTERFENAVVHPVLKYNDFMSRLRQCDLSLAAFPFGNANSTVDAFLLGIPVVAHSGPQPHSQSDARLIRAVGLPEWLINDSHEAYFQTALRLIEDDNLRRGVVDYLQHCDVEKKLYDAEATRFLSDFVDTFSWIYNHHEVIQQSGQWMLEVGKLPGQSAQAN
ncbi:MAG TPA: hypothetical protein VFF81_08385 [Noviherbaspirillum sp.]|nr:hypothetical protein [Noviherbaspirillum sp.]